MRIQDLKVVYICPDHNEKYHARKVHMDSMLETIGFKDIVHFKSGNEGYPRCLANANIDILTTYLDEPILLLEDDVEFTGVEEFDFVEDADAIYFGVSLCAGHSTLNCNDGFAVYSKYSNTQRRIHNMLGTHAILYISKAFKQAVIQQLKTMIGNLEVAITTNQPYNFIKGFKDARNKRPKPTIGHTDVAIARMQPNFKILANTKPSFFQSNKFNPPNHNNFYTKFELTDVALHLIATDRYTEFLDKIIRSAKKYFFPALRRHIVIYSNDTNVVNQLSFDHPTIEFHFKHINHESWPYVTLKRFEYFSSMNLNVDYSFYIDVDSEFIGELDNSFLPQWFAATEHPLEIQTNQLEKNPNSRAYLPNRTERYFCGGFFGGHQNHFMHLSTLLAGRIRDDLNRRVMAVWHDESHLNWYLYYHKPSTEYLRPFAVAESYTTATPESKILFLDKKKTNVTHTLTTVKVITFNGRFGFT